MTEFEIAMSFVEDIRERTTVSSVIDRFSKTITAFGFNSFLIAGVPRPGERLDGYQLASGMPEAWFERYLTNNYVLDDPVVKRLRATSRPFVWSDTLADSTTDDAGRLIMEEAKAFKLEDGFGVPVFGNDGFLAAVTMGGPALDLSDRDRGVLHLVAIYAHSQIRDLLQEEEDDVSRGIKLSPRELECLKWTSAGKTSWEISKILSISHHTVDWYLTSLGRKLGAANRTQAVAEAFRRGILQ